MTVIAWDGQTLAADKRGTSSGLRFKVTKIFRTSIGLIGVDGNYDVCMELLDWIRNGQVVSNYPKSQENDSRYSYLILIKPDKQIYRYERGPIPFKVEEPYFAVGSGRDFALAAMYIGKTAKEAVEIASHFQTDCGDGVDELEFEEEHV